MKLTLVETLDDPTFPPLLTGHGVKAPLKPFAEACRRAQEGGEFGAGDIFWGRSTDTVLWAVILEPEVPLQQAQQMMPLAMAAIGDCLGALTPPQVAVTFRWPNIILVNNGEAGHVKVGVQAGCANDAIPAWMVIGLDVGLTWPSSASEPGENPHLTVLAEEGCEELTRTKVIESYSRHFLTWLNIWQDEGFKPVADSWLFKAADRGETVTLNHGGDEVSGVFTGLDENGAMLLKNASGDMRLLELTDHFIRQ